MNNMLHQQPRMSKELQLLQYLQPRMTFSPQETIRYETLYKGFLGEIAFYNLVKTTLYPATFCSIYDWPVMAPNFKLIVSTLSMTPSLFLK